MAEEVKTLHCATHGDEPWKFTLVCKKCKRVFQARVEGVEYEPVHPKAVEAPRLCLCGADLVHDTARAICTSCFIERVDLATQTVQ